MIGVPISRQDAFINPGFTIKWSLRWNGNRYIITHTYNHKITQNHSGLIELVLQNNYQ